MVEGITEIEMNKAATEGKEDNTYAVQTDMKRKFDAKLEEVAVKCCLAPAAALFHILWTAMGISQAISQRSQDGRDSASATSQWNKNPSREYTIFICSQSIMRVCSLTDSTTGPYCYQNWRRFYQRRRSSH